MAHRFAKVSEEEIKTAFFYPSDLVNTKTTIPLRVGEEGWIYTSTLRVSVYIHHYSPPLRGIVVYYWDLSPRDRRDEQGGAPIATYPLGSRSQFCRGRKPECLEETLEVRLRSTETRSTYNIVEVEGVIDVHYASLTSQGVQHRVIYRDGHPSRYQLRPTGLNFGEQTGTDVFPFGDSRTSNIISYRKLLGILIGVVHCAVYSSCDWSE